MASYGAVFDYVSLTDTSDSDDGEDYTSNRRVSVEVNGALTQSRAQHVAQNVGWRDKQRSMSLQPPPVEPKRTLTSPRISARPPGERTFPPPGVSKPIQRFPNPFEDPQRSDKLKAAFQPPTEARTTVKTLTKDVSVKQEVFKLNQEVVRRASLSPEMLRAVPKQNRSPFAVPKQNRSLVPFTCNDVVEVKSSVQQNSMGEDTQLVRGQRYSESPPNLQTPSSPGNTGFLSPKSLFERWMGGPIEPELSPLGTLEEGSRSLDGSLSEDSIRVSIHPPRDGGRPPYMRRGLEQAPQLFPAKARVTVEVIEAKMLASRKYGGAPDPCCCISVHHSHASHPKPQRESYTTMSPKRIAGPQWLTGAVSHSALRAHHLMKPQARTCTAKQTVDPIWNETFFLKDALETTVELVQGITQERTKVSKLRRTPIGLLLTVHDAGERNHNFLGQAVLEPIAEGSYTERWLTLLQRNGAPHTDHAGNISSVRVRITFDAPRASSRTSPPSKHPPALRFSSSLSPPGPAPFSAHNVPSLDIIPKRRPSIEIEEARNIPPPDILAKRRPSFEDVPCNMPPSGIVVKRRPSFEGEAPAALFSGRADRDRSHSVERRAGTRRGSMETETTVIAPLQRDLGLGGARRTTTVALDALVLLQASVRQLLSNRWYALERLRARASAGHGVHAPHRAPPSSPLSQLLLRTAHLAHPSDGAVSPARSPLSTSTPQAFLRYRAVSLSGPPDSGPSSRTHPVVYASPSITPKWEEEPLFGRREMGGGSPMARKSNTPRVLELTPHRRVSSAGEGEKRGGRDRLQLESEPRVHQEREARVHQEKETRVQATRAEAPLATYYPGLETGFGRLSAGALDDERLHFSLKDRTPLGAAEALARVGLDLLRQPEFEQQAKRYIYESWGRLQEVPHEERISGRCWAIIKALWDSGVIRDEEHAPLLSGLARRTLLRQQEAAWEGGVRHEREEAEEAQREQRSPWELLAVGMERLREQIESREMIPQEMEAEYRKARKFPQSSARTWAELRGLDAGEAAKRLRERMDGPRWAPHAAGPGSTSTGKNAPGPGRGNLKSDARSRSPVAERSAPADWQAEAEALAEAQVASVLQLELEHAAAQREFELRERDLEARRAYVTNRNIPQRAWSAERVRPGRHGEPASDVEASRRQGGRHLHHSPDPMFASSANSQRGGELLPAQLEMGRTPARSRQRPHANRWRSSGESSDSEEEGDELDRMAGRLATAQARSLKNGDGWVGWERANGPDALQSLIEVCTEMNNVLAHYKRRSRSGNAHQRSRASSNGRSPDGRPRSSLKWSGADTVKGGRSWNGGNGGTTISDVWRETSVVREPASAPQASKFNRGAERYAQSGHSRARWRVSGSADRVRRDEMGESRLQMLEEQLRVLDTNSYL